MESLYLANAVADAPAVPQDVTAGRPTDGSSTGGTPATIPGAVWYDAVTQEQVNVILAGGLTPNRNALNQMALAIQAMIDAAKAELQAQIDDLSGNLFAPGSIAFFAQADAPANWLVADGRAVSRSTYSDLFSAIGTTYGAGNGSSTFNLPNLMGRVAWGASMPGESIAAGLPNITGSIWAARTGEGSRPSTVASGAFSEASRWNAAVHHGGDDDWGSEYALDASRSSPVYGRSSTVQPPALKLLPCIHI